MRARRSSDSTTVVRAIDRTTRAYSVVVRARSIAWRQDLSTTARSIAARYPKLRSATLRRSSLQGGGGRPHHAARVSVSGRYGVGTHDGCPCHTRCRSCRATSSWSFVPLNSGTGSSSARQSPVRCGGSGDKGTRHTLNSLRAGEPSHGCAGDSRMDTPFSGDRSAVRRWLDAAQVVAARSASRSWARTWRRTKIGTKSRTFELSHRDNSAAMSSSIGSGPTRPENSGYSSCIN